MGLWHLDEQTGSMAADSSRYHNNGTLTRFTDLSAVWVPGKFGNALAVENAGYVLVPFSPSIDSIATAVTVSAWFYYDGTITEMDQYGTAISRQIGTGIDQYYHLSLRYAEGDPNLFIAPTAASTQQVMAMKAIPRSTWVHLAGTYDGMTEALYVNGELVMPKAVSGHFAPDTTGVILGGNMNGSNVTEQFPGWIDEITLYNRALSPDEIAQLAQAPVL